MDITQQVISGVIPRGGLSKLKPFRELIAGLRRKRVGYREIAKILSERCGLPVSKSAVHSFVRVRAMGRLRKQYEMPDVPAPAEAGTTVNRTELQAKFDALRERKPTSPPKKLFEYREGRPLTLIVSEPTKVAK